MASTQLSTRQKFKILLYFIIKIVYVMYMLLKCNRYVQKRNVPIWKKFETS